MYYLRIGSDGIWIRDESKFNRNSVGTVFRELREVNGRKNGATDRILSHVSTNTHNVELPETVGT